MADSVADAAYPAPAEALADSAAEAYPVEEAVGETGGEIPAEDVAEEEDIDHAEPEGEASDAPAGPIDIAVAPADDESEAGTTDDGAAADTSAETGDAAAGAYPAEEPAPTEPVPAEPEPETPAAEPIIHTVAPGETLFRIGLKYGVAWTEIAQANGITDPNRITAGQQLVIPGTEATPSAPGQGSTHVVQPGQTLASIAQQYGVSWPDLAAANNIGWPYTIYAGQTLIIPGS